MILGFSQKPNEQRLEAHAAEHQADPMSMEPAAPHENLGTRCGLDVNPKSRILAYSCATASLFYF